ncbi:ANTAR domain-containing protein [Streptomyces sp. JJ36]|uniref:GAF and ANTAR domain-containing protein n=1 Tax=Streptomyces sp. JJ36 TaxID=2736645 RepID=UPI001F2117F0|nr:ANTAR domain-containing protein [Streptomyces sp. JJ36]MCF6525457.1 ANTAR domain-containing protein [Streptomyces sp. JJ36]
MAEEALSPVRADSVHLPGEAGSSLWLLRAEGGIDSADHPLFALATEPPSHVAAPTVAMDLTLVHLLSARGARGLLCCAEHFAAAGAALRLAVANPAIERVLEVSGVAEATEVHPNVQELFEACVPRGALEAAVVGAGRPEAGAPATGLCAGDGEAAGKEVEALRAEVRNLRARVRTHPLIDQALGVLLERYGLPGPRRAFELLRRCSQVYNIRLRTLAAALVADPRGDGEQPPAAHRQPPRLSFLPRDHAGTVNAGTVVNAVLERTLEIAGADMGSVQLVDPLTGGLRLEAHEGLSEEFVDFFDRVGGDGTPCGQAARHRVRVTVTDVATGSGAFPESVRAVLLAAGSRAVHSTPLTDGAACVGVANAHMARPGRMLTSGQARALDEMGAQAGRWLTWHRNTAVRDALKYLHLRAPGFRDDGTGPGEPAAPGHEAGVPRTR